MSLGKWKRLMPSRYRCCYSPQLRTTSPFSRERSHYDTLATIARTMCVTIGQRSPYNVTIALRPTPDVSDNYVFSSAVSTGKRGLRFFSIFFPGLARIELYKMNLNIFLIFAFQWPFNVQVAIRYGFNWKKHLESSAYRRREE